MRQRRVDGAERGFLASFIAIEAQHRLRHEAPQQPDLLWRQRRTERGDTVAETGFRQSHDVHVAFYHDDPLALVCDRPRAGGVEQHVALVKQRCLGRIEILCRRGGVERAAAERDHAALHIRNREHHAVAETIIWDGDIVAADQHARPDHVDGREALFGEVLFQHRPAIWRKAETECDDGFALQAPPRDVSPRLGAVRSSQLLAEKLRRRRQHGIKPLAFVLDLDKAGLRLRRGRLGHRHACFLRQPLDGFGERQTLGRHQKLEDVAVLAGCKAVVEAFGIVDEKRRRPLLFERRQAAELTPSFLERHAPSDDVADGQPRADFIKESVIESHVDNLRDSLGSPATRLP